MTNPKVKARLHIRLPHHNSSQHISRRIIALNKEYAVDHLEFPVTIEEGGIEYIFDFYDREKGVLFKFLSQYDAETIVPYRELWFAANIYFIVETDPGCNEDDIDAEYETARQFKASLYDREANSLLRYVDGEDGEEWSSDDEEVRKRLNSEM